MRIPSVDVVRTPDVTEVRIETEPIESIREGKSARTENVEHVSLYNVIGVLLRSLTINNLLIDLHRTITSAARRGHALLTIWFVLIRNKSIKTLLLYYVITT